MAQIVVLSADDNEAFAYIIPRWLRNEPRIRHATHLPSAAGLAEYIDLVRPDVVVLDVDMPGPDPIEQMQHAIGRFPGVGFIALISDHGDAEPVRTAGASAVVHKDEGASELVSAVLRVAAMATGEASGAFAERQPVSG